MSHSQMKRTEYKVQAVLVICDWNVPSLIQRKDLQAGIRPAQAINLPKAPNFVCYANFFDENTLWMR